MKSLSHCINLSGSTLEIVTDKSQEGSQFVRGFGGVGGILRYKVDLQNLNIDEDAEPIDYSKSITLNFPFSPRRFFFLQVITIEHSLRNNSMLFLFIFLSIQNLSRVLFFLSPIERVL